MSKTVLIITLLLEVLLYSSRRFATWLKENDKYGEREKIPTQWELFPYSFKAAWYQKKSNADKVALKPPKVKNPHSRKL